MIVLQQKTITIKYFYMYSIFEDLHLVCIAIRCCIILQIPDILRPRTWGDYMRIKDSRHSVDSTIVISGVVIFSSRICKLFIEHAKRSNQLSSFVRIRWPRPKQ